MCESGTISRSRAFRMLTDAYMKGDEDARLADEPRDYEARRLEAEGVARALLRVDDHTDQEWNDGG